MAEPPDSPVQDYYERNTRMFLRLGREQVIHRAVWGPGVGSLPAALHYAHARIAEAASRSGVDVLRVLDLGCGVGASSRWLAEALPAELVGVTISQTQAELAASFARRAGASRCRFEVADFGDLPAALGSFHAAFAIEAFAHAPDADAFFGSVAARLRPRGVLILVDDFHAPGVDPSHPVLRRFASGWHVPAVREPAQVAAAAGRHGFRWVEDEDWTPYLRLWRPRDRLVHWLQPAIRGFAGGNDWLQSLVGGDALQVALSAGLVHYRWQLYHLP